MKKLEQIKIQPTNTIKEAMAAINAGSIRIAVVVDADEKFTGTVSDGDIRRGLLAGLTLDSPVETIINRNPVTARVSDDRDSILQLAVVNKISQIPLVDENGRLLGIEVVDDLLLPVTRDNPVVLMAGGLGTRLGELTKDLPKPMLAVGGKPILETIIRQFARYGFKNIIISVNYLSHIIENYFGNGSRFGVNISYIHETKRLGTAGALDLARERLTSPFFVMNGDILTTINLAHLHDFHMEQKSMATMCVREYDFQVPYGTVNMKDGRITSIDEKPIHKFFVSAGIYMLSPEALNNVPPDTFFDMPTLFEKLIQKEQNVLSFPLREYWLDIGHLNDYNKAQGEYREIFS